MGRPSNEEIAAAFDRIADLLSTQGASVFRVRAYRRGAETCRSWERPLAEIAQEGGREGLMELPGIGSTLATQIVEIVRSGRIAMLERLEGQVSPEDLFTLLPGVGEVLAERLHRELGAETLEDLEVAAHDGRLEAVPGVGPERARAIRDSLALHLSHAAREGCVALHRAASTPNASHGSPCSTASGMDGRSPPSTRIRHGPTSSAPTATGW